MSQFLNLPQEVQFEIFSFLSVKHLGKILSINKSTRQQILRSESFFKELLSNYYKLITERELTLIENEEINYENVKQRILYLIDQKRKELSSLAIECERIQCEMRELQELIAFRKAMASTNENVEITSESFVSKKLEIKYDQIQAKIKSKVID